MSEREPFSGNGDQHGAVPRDEKPSGSSNEAQGNADAGAEAPAAANVLSSPVDAPVASRPCWCGAPAMVTDASRCSRDDDHRICKCGAGPHPTRAGRCANVHPYPGFGHELSDRGKGYSTRPPDTDGIDAHLAANSETYRASIESEVWTQTLGFLRSLHRSADARKPRIVQQMLSMHQQARSISADLQAAAPPPDPPEVFENVARLCALHADEFAGCLRRIVELKPALAEALRVVLAEHDGEPQPEAEPVVPVPSEPDGKPRAVVPDVVIL